jgi:glucose-6-phosphate 1-epimerase
MATSAALSSNQTTLSDSSSTNSGYDMIRTVTHSASQSHIQIHSFGATILSYCTPTTTTTGTGSMEHLFVSKQAILDGSVPIRGGIPVVFPIFGPPPTWSGSSMPQHGYARRNAWTLVHEQDDAENARVVYQLDLRDVQHGRGQGNLWSAETDLADRVNCILELTVTFNASHLTTRLTIRNASAVSVGFPFQALLHTYYKVEQGAALQPAQCFVQGLQGYDMDDKVTGESAVAKSDPVTIAGEVDRVYTPPSDGTSSGSLQVTIGVGHDAPRRLHASVWNPHQAKAAAMADFGNEEYHDMICVEPGILGTNHELAAGQEAWLEQTIYVD